MSYRTHTPFFARAQMPRSDYAGHTLPSTKLLLEHTKVERTRKDGGTFLSPVEDRDELEKILAPLGPDGQNRARNHRGTGTARKPPAPR